MRENCGYKGHYRETVRAKITTSENGRRRISWNTTSIAHRLLICLLLKIAGSHLSSIFVNSLIEMRSTVKTLHFWPIVDPVQFEFTKTRKLRVDSGQTRARAIYILTCSTYELTNTTKLQNIRNDNDATTCLMHTMPEFRIAFSSSLSRPAFAINFSIIFCRPITPHPSRVGLTEPSLSDFQLDRTRDARHASVIQSPPLWFHRNRVIWKLWEVAEVWGACWGEDK